MVAAVTVEVKEHFQLIERPWSQGIRNGGRLLRVITYFYYAPPLCLPPTHPPSVSRSICARVPRRREDDDDGGERDRVEEKDDDDEDVVRFLFNVRY